MDILKAVFNGCLSILNKHMNLCGYSISLANVLIFALVGTVLIRIFYKLFD